MYRWRTESDILESSLFEIIVMDVAGNPRFEIASGSVSWAGSHPVMDAQSVVLGSGCGQ